MTAFLHWLIIAWLIEAIAFMTALAFLHAKADYRAWRWRRAHPVTIHQI